MSQSQLEPGCVSEPVWRLGVSQGQLESGCVSEPVGA